MILYNFYNSDPAQNNWSEIVKLKSIVACTSFIFMKFDLIFHDPQNTQISISWLHPQPQIKSLPCSEPWAFLWLVCIECLIWNPESQAAFKVNITNTHPANTFIEPFSMWFIMSTEKEKYFPLNIQPRETFLLFWPFWLSSKEKAFKVSRVLKNSLLDQLKINILQY